MAHGIGDGSFKHRNPPEIRGTGYVGSLEAALWAFHRSDNFRDGALLAANLGDDADTTAAIYGQLAGAYYGAGGIPAEWVEKLTMAVEITSMADDLFSLALGVTPVEVEPTVREVATVTETSVTIAGVEVRWVSVLLEGHTVEQVLSYDVAEAEAVFGRPFDDEMNSEMRSAMYSADRIWLGETMWKVASATSYVLDGKCIRTAKIEHCDDIRGCIPGASAISHQVLTSP